MPSKEIEVVGTAACTLTLEGDRLHVRRPGDAQPIPANIVYLRPLSARTENCLLR